MLTADQAAEIAARHGLTLGDAASLRALADDPDEADRIAARFAVEPSPEDLAKAVRSHITGGN